VRTPKGMGRGSVAGPAKRLRDAMLGVLKGLEAFADHVYPFVHPVKKSEAPDYYDVIKEPMDLGTMGKKVRRGDYTSRAAFAADLSLIWSNVRTKL